MIRIRDIALPLAHDVNQLPFMAAQLLHISTSEIASLKIVKKSLDARKKDNIQYVYTVDVALKRGESRILRQNRSRKISAAQPCFYRIPKPARPMTERPVIVGFGPAGMFAALVLAKAGCRPIVLERGADAQTRKRLVEEFWAGGRLDPDCNVQFGEGGAGTFSDGKLNTGIKNERIGWVLEQFVKAGAPENILYDAKPHVGTDILCGVVQSIRQEVLRLGGEVQFRTTLTGLLQKDGRICGVEVQQAGQLRTISCSDVILAIGHSARDTFRALCAQGVPMEPKPFSLGVRIEHRQQTIDSAQFGAAAGNPALPPADYKLSVHLPDGGSAYTFCMCPGGYVVAAASEPGRIVTNGMSESGRNGENANSALLVTFRPEDFPDPSPLGGMLCQQALEEKAFLAGGGNYFAPCQRVEDFLAGRKTTALGAVKPTYRPGVTLADLNEILPEKIADVLRRAIPELGKQLRGFDDPDALLTAPETRSSSPVRILRDENRQSAVKGLFPCGEGAGYAGGIISAAVDGMMCAEAVLACQASDTSLT